MFYEKLLNINKFNFEKKKVLIIGGGYIGTEYCNALKTMGIKEVTIITQTEKTALKCCAKFGYTALYGGYEKILPSLNGNFDLIIVATPVHLLKPVADFSVELGHKNILVEKPGSLYSPELEKWSKASNAARIRIGYNRLLYPSLWKLIDISLNKEPITSCFYTFTEWVRTINFTNNEPECYQRWGIANSLHIISMAHFLIGLPKEISVYKRGYLSWHPIGSIFVGSGITNKEIPFSYHANWRSGGRWGIEVMTPSNVFRLIPLEELYKCAKGNVSWERIEVNAAYPQVKPGIAEEIAVMLESELEEYFPLLSLKEVMLYTKLAEKIFGYTNSELANNNENEVI